VTDDDGELKSHALSVEARQYAEQIADQSPHERIVIVAFQEGTEFGASVIRTSDQALAPLIKALRQIASQLEQN
jgi:hypothetical protein